MITKTTLIWSVIIALIVGGLIGHFTRTSSPQANKTNSEYNSSAQTVNTDKEITLYTNMRKLWADHALWTREYIIDAVNGSPAANAAAARLMKNQEDIGNAVASYYGKDAGNQLTTLLKEHISIAVEIVAAAKANDQAKFKDANARWKTNADQIAAFLSSANPNWPKSTLEDMMSMHLSTTADELNAVLSKQYDKSVTAFDAVFDHILKMSDALSAGIIKQFPDKF
jgi:hypothetical protein